LTKSVTLRRPEKRAIICQKDKRAEHAGKEIQKMTGKTGIIAAMAEEVKCLKAALTDGKTVRTGGMDFYTGCIGGQEVVLLQCGIGKVSAAIGAQIMITAFAPDRIINTGCAGALAQGLGIGDMVLSTATVEWDMDLLALGLPRGFLTALNTVELPADGALRAAVRTAIPEGVAVREGIVVSGDQFVASNAQREIILGSFPGALCAEMEGAAIGHVCVQNGVPYCVVRCMSDTADGDSSVAFDVFCAEAGEKSAAVLLRMLGYGA